MIVKTKKYKLETKTYIGLGMKNILREQWWVFLIAAAIMAMYFVLPSIWWIIGAVIALILYILFWLIQFTGVTQMEQNKILFDKLSYEISSQQVLIKVNPRQGMPLAWNMIKKATIEGEAINLFVSKAQIIHLPFRIFNTDNERRFVETILKRKGLIKDKEAAVQAK
ncbi:hypothetical protein [Cesiribacter andamanensis]|uniref:YcxB-like C-terminal domain-containing protein n=1 Tax=Cesiribacter andamanensis AMV16 TaxID=1279009 RepID=M7NBZ7_9BACT|nr:hypothetical protein [Cesiribacter andamanensis]EMR04701.1 hypothetical protein ADICEAN_00153 [Cesiribacter andamanensis AMV16]